MSRRTIKSILMLVLVLAVTLNSSVMPVRADEDAPEQAEWFIENITIVGGAAATETSFLVANELEQAFSTYRFDNIIIAPAEDCDTAISADYMAMMLGAPVIMTTNGAINVVARYVQSNLSSDGRVFIIGGAGSISINMDSALAAYGLSPVRLSGSDAYETNLAVLEDAGVYGKTLVVCSSASYAATAAAAGLPVMIVGDDLTASQKHFLQIYSGDYYGLVYVGSNQVIADELRRYDPGCTTLSGSNDVMITLMLARYLYGPEGNGTIVLADGMTDGICASTLAFAYGCPLIIIDDLFVRSPEDFDDMPIEYGEYLLSSGVKDIISVGTRHTWGEPIYTWAEDNSSVTARCECTITACGEVREETVTTEITEIAPTCTEKGMTTYTAAFRSHIFEAQIKTFELDALGHRWGDWIRIKEPTYTEDGEEIRTCPTCGETETNVIPAMEKNPVIRVAGSNRYLTAIEAANHLKEKGGISKFDNIIVVSGADFPDALSASYLAYKKDCPILLVNSGTIAMVTDYINSNLAPGGTVYIVGGTGAVPAAVDQKISGTVKRLAGNNRYDTNLAVLKEARLEYKEAEGILVACGTDFADALSASAVGEPVLLVGKELTSKQIEYLSSFIRGEDEVWTASAFFSIIGGTGAVPQRVEDQLKQLNIGGVERISGINRYDTSMAVAERYFSGSLDTVVIANGKDFPDGLSGGPIATAYTAPLILVIDGVSGHAVNYFAEKEAFRLLIMGGTGVISDATAGQIANRTV